MERILMGHGSGGSLMHQLIKEHLAPVLGVSTLNDSAVMECESSGRIAVTTDSYVVSPIFFPGGDIGMLAVCGTVNDLSVSGARPVCLTAGFIIEEGFPVSDLKKILLSMRKAADSAGVRIVAGDTKVVDKGKADGIFINTAGLGFLDEGVDMSPMNMRPGDRVIVSGPVGSHGISIMAGRNGITFDPPLLSDAAPLNSLTELMLRMSRNIRVMRDPTRGGIASTLKEFVLDSGLCIEIEEDAVPVLPSVRGACELLGLDPFYAANEGILVAVADAADAEKLVDEMRKSGLSPDARIIGGVLEAPARTVLLKTVIGGVRIIDMHTADQLPRIC